MKLLFSRLKVLAEDCLLSMSYCVATHCIGVEAAPRTLLKFSKTCIAVIGL